MILETGGSSIVLFLITGLLLIILVYASSKLLTLVYHQLPRRKGKIDREEEVLQLLLLVDLLNAESIYSGTTSRDYNREEERSW